MLGTLMKEVQMNNLRLVGLALLLIASGSQLLNGATRGMKEQFRKMRAAEAAKSTVGKSTFGSDKLGGNGASGSSDAEPLASGEPAGSDLDLSGSPMDGDSGDVEASAGALKPVNPFDNLSPAELARVRANQEGIAREAVAVFNPFAKDDMGAVGFAQTSAHRRLLRDLTPAQSLAEVEQYRQDAVEYGSAAADNMRAERLGVSDRSAEVLARHKEKQALIAAARERVEGEREDVLEEEAELATAEADLARLEPAAAPTGRRVRFAAEAAAAPTGFSATPELP